MQNSEERYFGDARDQLEAIYPTCASFVRVGPISFAERTVEIAFDPSDGNEEDRRHFARICYSYEDSFDWDRVQLVFRSSKTAEVLWRIGGRIAHRCSLSEAAASFDQITEKIK
jgi:hypothetical protein